MGMLAIHGKAPLYAYFFKHGFVAFASYDLGVYLFVSNTWPFATFTTWDIISDQTFFLIFSLEGLTAF